MTEPLMQLYRQGVLGDQDVQFARLMCRLADNQAPELALGAALASRWTASGHVCLALAAEAGKPLGMGAERWVLPEKSSWEAALRQSPVVGRPGEYRPLILDQAGRLYLYRYWEYQQELAEALRLRAGLLAEGVDEALLQEGLQRLFPKQPSGQADWQKLAAATAVLRRFCVISGGPGTGKTSTVLRILALLRQQPGGAELNIALAAPTGKAAARLQESIHSAKGRLGMDEPLCMAIPEQASTLHRLLGAKPQSVYFRYDRDNLLPVDVLVIDEASMVDIALMAKLMRALPEQARLILLGDKDQLASVEAGAVLADICGEAPGFSEDFRKKLLQLTGEQIPPSAGAVSTLADAVVLLQRSFRFEQDSDIGQLAAAVNAGRAGDCFALLQEGRCQAIGRLSPHESVAAAAAQHYLDYLRCLRAGAPVGEVFDVFNRFRVLCAVRTGPAGVEALNRDIEARLEAEGLIDTRCHHYAGRPVMITRNEHDLRLYNGDIGILFPHPGDGGRLQVLFQTGEGMVRKVSPARLPEHETVYAMTVHKSQGSEFDRVLLVLPPGEGLHLSRELVYTGITRARQRFEISTTEQALRQAVEQRLERVSGLRDALWHEGA